MAASSSRGPLHDRVLDISETIAGAYCAKLLGDLGADVVKVERPGTGDPSRASGPFRDDRPDPEASAPFLYFNTSKRGMTLDLDRAESHSTLSRLIRRFDVVIADGPESALAARGLGVEQLRRWNPEAIVTTISGFGSDGPYAGYQSTHLVMCALGGWSYTCGLPDRPPLQSGGSLTDTVAGAYAAVGVLGAIAGRHRHGGGDHVDVSSWEAAITCALGPTMTWETRQEIPDRNSQYNTGPSFFVACRDGHVGVNVLTEAQWETLCLFIDRPDLLVDPRFGDPLQRATHVVEIEAAVAAAFATRGAEEVFHDAQSWRLPFGLVVSPAAALALSTHEERGYFEAHDHPVAGAARTPRMPFVLRDGRARPTRAPLLGEHDDELLAELDDVPFDDAGPAAAPVAASHRGAPLNGLRIIDFTMFQAGPMATLMASDLGADVIKIEAVQRLDGWRGVGRGGDRPWEHSGLFNWANRGKRGITLNLNDARAVDLVRRLVATADVVVENYTPRVMANFGLDYERLAEIKPDLVMLSMPGFGREGSWRDYTAFAWTTEQLSMICHLTGDEDSGPLFTSTTCGDPLAGLMGAIALLTALEHRRATGLGQHVDLSQVESATSFMADALVAAQLTGRDPGRSGNDHPDCAPHGIYPCRDEEWLAIACRDDDDWEHLATLAGDDVPALRSGFDGVADRLAARRALDAHLGTWTASRDAHVLMHELQRAGVPAGVVMDGPDLLADAHLRARGFFIPQSREDRGIVHQLAEPFRLAAACLPPARPAPFLGEHNRAVLGGLLGVDDDELRQLEVDHVIGNAPI